MKMQCTAYDIAWLTSSSSEGTTMNYETGSGPVQPIETPEGRGYYVPREGPKYVTRRYEMGPALVVGDAPERDGNSKQGFPWWLVLAAGGAYAVAQL